MSKKMKTIDIPNESPYCQKDMYIRTSNPFTMLFIYPEREEPVIVKGRFSWQGIDKYLKDHYPYSFYRCTYWNDGKSVGYWRCTNNEIEILEPERKPKRSKRQTPEEFKKELEFYNWYGYHPSKYTLIARASNNKRIVITRWKRMPHQWNEHFRDGIKIAREEILKNMKEKGLI